MSKYEKYRIPELQTSTSSKYAKYKIMPKNQNLGDQDDSYADVIGKSFNRGVSGLLDLPQLAGQAVEGLGNLTTDTPTDYFSSLTPVSEHVRKFANQAGYGGFNKPKANTTGKKIASKAGEFAGSLVGSGSLGLAAKGAGALKTAKFLGAPQTTREAAKLAGLGGAIGGTSGALQENTGLDPLAADLASSVIAPAALATRPKHLLNVFKKTGETAAKVPLKLMGLSPKGLNVEAATAARDLGIDLPAAALTDSTLTGLADQWIGKTPLFGNKLKKKYATTEEQTLKALDDIYEGTGPVRTPEIEKEISKLYRDRINALPEGSSIAPINTIKSLDNIRIKSAYPSSDEKNLLQTIETLKNELNPTISSKYGNVKIPVQDYNIDKLIGTKQSLNSIIKWDMDEGVKNQLRGIQKGITKDIAEYGKANPEWYKTYKEADSLFGKVAKREKLENKLSGPSTNHAREAFSYNALSKAINTPDKARLIKKDVTPEIFDKIQKLGTVAKAMAIKNSSIPNPSGTAITGATIGVIYGLATNPIGLLSGSGIAGVTGAAAASHLLTDKKFLDLALKFAEKGGKNKFAANALNKRIQDLTGYSTISLNNELQHMGAEEGQ